MPVKDLVKTILFPPGYRKRRIIGGALKGLWFSFDLRADTQQWRGIYEQALQDWLHKHVKPGDICLDIGAANGYFTLLMAKLAGKSGHIYAFEPSAVSTHIQPHFDMNPEQDLARLSVLTSYVVASANDSGDEITIDELVYRESLTRVDVVKIDVDGGEIDVLQGMEQTLSQFHPHLFVEVHSRELLAGVEKITKKHGYVMRLEDPPAHEERPLEFNSFLFSTNT